MQQVKIDLPRKRRADGSIRERRVTYQLELIRCGKTRCRCKSGELHGPYWFAYWRHVGRKRKRYVGAELKLLTFEQLEAKERSETRKKARAAKLDKAAAVVVVP